MSRKPKLGLANPALTTLRNASDVREGQRMRSSIAELDTDLVVTAGRLDDRLETDLSGLVTSISAHGQRVPILVRPRGTDQYELIYGRRRFEACRTLGLKVRAIVTDLNDAEALRDQITENQERRDLSFIERAMVAAALKQGEFLPAEGRTNRAVGEILGVEEATVSQLLTVFSSVGEDLVRAIGPAPSIGRPRWERLKAAMNHLSVDSRPLVDAALAARAGASGDISSSDAAFEAVSAIALDAEPSSKPRPATKAPAPLHQIKGVGTASVRSSARGKRLHLDLDTRDTKFISWLEAQAPKLITELHERFKRSED